MGVCDDLVSLSGYVFDRTWLRLQGLSDAEYLWEPVVACWSVRVGPEGETIVDSGTGKEPPPFTTVAWRIWHLTGCYGSDRNELWLRGTTDGSGGTRCQPRASATDALDALQAANDWWTALLASLSDEELRAPLGSVAGPYAEQTRTAFVLHQLDEMIHHGAELGVLRDLYRGSSPGAFPDASETGRRSPAPLALDPNTVDRIKRLEAVATAARKLFEGGSASELKRALDGLV